MNAREAYEHTIGTVGDDILVSERVGKIKEVSVRVVTSASRASVVLNPTLTNAALCCRSYDAIMPKWARTADYLRPSGRQAGASQRGPLAFEP